MISPWYTGDRLTLNAYAALPGKGTAGKFAEGSSGFHLLKILLSAYIVALKKLLLMIRKRKDFKWHIRTTKTLLSHPMVHPAAAERDQEPRRVPCQGICRLKADTMVFSEVTCSDC